jgi:hypothetical protein
MSRLLLASELLWVGVASEPLALYGPWATALARYSVALQAARALSGVQHTC